MKGMKHMKIVGAFPRELFMPFMSFMVPFVVSSSV